MEIIASLLENNSNIIAYDPQAMNTAQAILGDKIKYAPDMYSTLQDADVVAILTEWKEFKTFDYNKASSLMKHKNIVDCRNLLCPQMAENNGFTYQGIGK
jgi:UDPglucose 6-dehydrogenase